MRRDMFINVEKFFPGTENQDAKISLLANSVYYYLGSVYLIMSAENKYRLVVLHNGQILFDEYYRCSRAARVAFSRLYGNRLWKKDIKPFWTPFFDPDVEFIDVYGKKVRKFLL